MILWIDAQLSPALASWISATFNIQAIALRDLGLRDATDRDIFLAARREAAIVCTKDSDFVRLVQDLGSPPSVILITCGNTSNAPPSEDITGRIACGAETLTIRRDRSRSSLTKGYK